MRAGFFEVIRIFLDKIRGKLRLISIWLDVILDMIWVDEFTAFLIKFTLIFILVEHSAYTVLQVFVHYSESTLLIPQVVVLN